MVTTRAPLGTDGGVAVAVETTQLWYVHVLLDCLRGTGGGAHQLTFDTITDGHVDSPGARFLFLQT